ncbi:hypothetical protein IV01_17785 [Pseudomonas syringae]|uniref:Uncharacterized protein n=1 Tax=Pseudomonas syringae TaxID=317 RepID=A0A085VEV3_PSESX|nr:hypothetical protein IV01_17785 [Pseudomonas syringae]
MIGIKCLGRLIPVGAVLARDKNTSVCLIDQGALIAGKHRSHKSDLNIGATTWDRLQPGRGQYIHPIFFV